MRGTARLKPLPEGVTKQEKLTFAIEGKGTGAGTIKGTMAFDRKDYRMNKGVWLTRNL
jgi:polyisoprenoid-binding protein YceI